MTFLFINSTFRSRVLFVSTTATSALARLARLVSKTGLGIDKRGPGALKVCLRVLEACAGILDACPSLLDLGIKERRIDLGNHLVLLHLGIKIGIEGFDRP